nr:myb-like protein A [Dermatophagoides farinae]
MALEQSLVDEQFNDTNYDLWNAPTPCISHRDNEDPLSSSSDTNVLINRPSSPIITTTTTADIATDPLDWNDSTCMYNLDLASIQPTLYFNTTLVDEHQLLQQQQQINPIIKNKDEFSSLVTLTNVNELQQTLVDPSRPQQQQQQPIFSPLYEQNLKFEQNVQFVANIAGQLQDQNQYDDNNNQLTNNQDDDDDDDDDNDDLISQYSLSTINQPQQSKTTATISNDNNGGRRSTSKKSTKIVCMNPNAIAARQNRAKKKTEMQILINRNEKLESELAQYKQMYDGMANILDKTQNRVNYLELILRQTPQIMELIEHMKKLPTIRLNSVHINNDQQFNMMNDDDHHHHHVKKRLKSSTFTTTKMDGNNHSIAAHTTNVHYQNPSKDNSNAGICFHVKPNCEMSLQFCHNCSNASNSNNNSATTTGSVGVCAGGGGGGGGKTMIRKSCC